MYFFVIVFAAIFSFFVITQAAFAQTDAVKEENHFLNVDETRSVSTVNQSFYEQYLMQAARQNTINPNVALAYNNLGMIYKQQNRTDEAEKMLSEAVEMNRKLMPKSTQQLAINLNNLATLQFNSGQYDQAEAAFEESLSLKETFLDKNDESYLTTLNNLSQVYFLTGKEAEAQKTMEQLMQAREASGATTNGQYIMTLSNLANVYKKQGNLVESEKLYLKAIELREKDLTQATMPELATNYNNLANVYVTQKQFGKAEQYYMKALKINEDLYGENQSQMYPVLRNLASYYQETGQQAKANQILSRISSK